MLADDNAIEVKPSWLLLLVTAINSIGIAAFVGVCLILAAAPFFGSAFTPAFFGALIFAPPGILFLITVRASVLKRRPWALQLLPILYGLASFYCFFGVLANVAECFTDIDNIDWNFILTFGVIGSTLAVYLALCMLISIRWHRRLRHSTYLSGT